MKMHHNTRGWNPDRTDPVWAERVEREAEVTTDATERRHHKAQERLARAVARAEAEQSRKKPDRKKVKSLWAAVESRRQELQAIERVMTRSPAGSQHRGTVAYRGVSRGGTL